MNFNDLTYDELDEHAIQRLVFDNEEISPVLKGHIFIENVLEDLISYHLKEPKALFSNRRSFELKIDLAKAMGLIDAKHYSAFKCLNNIRNKYAHKHDYAVHLRDLNGLIFDWEAIQKKAFDVAKTKSTAEAARISIIFLCWKAIALIKTETSKTPTSNT